MCQHGSLDHYYRLVDKSVDSRYLEAATPERSRLSPLHVRIAAGTAALVVASALMLSSCGPRHMRARKATGPAGSVASTTVTTPPQPVWPLTGMPIPPGSPDAQRRAVAVKIDNETRFSQPQWGLNHADLIVEEVTEGSGTRFMAVFQSQGADKIGPVRSVRPVDVKLRQILGKPILAFSGGQPAILDMVKAAGIDYFTEGTATMNRDRSRKSGHDVFTSTDALWAAVPDNATPPPLFANFSQAPLVGGRAANNVSINLTPIEKSKWVYDSSAGKYTRLYNGSPQILGDGSQLQANNIVVQVVDELQTGLFDVLKAPVPDWQVFGSGKVYVIRNGQAVEGHWERAPDSPHLSLTGPDGKPLTLSPGSTWLSLLPSKSSIDIQ